MLKFIPALILLMVSCRHPRYTSMHTESRLEGSWKLSYVASQGNSTKELYPEKLPEISFDVKNRRLNGYTGCNHFNGSFKLHESRMDLKGPFAMTRMMCGGEGERVFLKELEGVNTFEADEETLTLIAGDIAVMRLVRISEK